MLLDRKGIKAQAKGIVKTARVSAYTFTLVYLLIIIALTVVNNLFGAETNLDPEVQLQLQQMGIVVMEVPHLITVPASVATFIGLVVVFAEVVFGCGYNLYHLGVRRGREMGYNTLIEGFAFAGKAILLSVVMEIFIFLWMLLFIIPGIIAAYRYRFAFLNLCENPDIGVMDAIRMSKVQTAGYKWQLFVVDLSFLGWIILSVLTAGILLIWVEPYMSQTYIGCFEVCKKASGVGSFPTDSPKDDLRSLDA